MISYEKIEFYAEIGFSNLEIEFSIQKLCLLKQRSGYLIQKLILLV